MVQWYKANIVYNIEDDPLECILAEDIVVYLFLDP